VQYLQIRHKEAWLDFILPIKWIVIFASIFTIFYLILTMFKTPKTAQDSCNAKKTHISFDNESKEKKNLSKQEIRKLAQELIDRKKGSK
jgi:uncharacterized membrane protein